MGYPAFSKLCLFDQRFVQQTYHKIQLKNTVVKNRNSKTAITTFEIITTTFEILFFDDNNYMPMEKGKTLKNIARKLNMSISTVSKRP
jgi:hypothetical protein